MQSIFFFRLLRTNYAIAMKTDFLIHSCPVIPARNNTIARRLYKVHRPPQPYLPLVRLIPELHHFASIHCTKRSTKNPAGGSSNNHGTPRPKFSGRTGTPKLFFLPGAYPHNLFFRKTGPPANKIISGPCPPQINNARPPPKRAQYRRNQFPENSSTPPIYFSEKPDPLQIFLIAGPLPPKIIFLPERTPTDFIFG